VIDYIIADGNLIQFSGKMKKHTPFDNGWGIQVAFGDAYFEHNLLTGWVYIYPRGGGCIMITDKKEVDIIIDHVTDIIKRHEDHEDL
jgi:hypothetical protein